MQAREKTRILTGGLILITVGVLILLNTHTEYVFSRTWPVFLIVMETGARPPPTMLEGTDCETNSAAW